MPGSHTLQYPRYSPVKILNASIITIRLFLMSCHESAPPTLSTHIPAKYLLRTPYDFQDIAQIIFLMSRSNHDVASTIPYHNKVPAKHQCPIPYGFRNTVLTT